MGIETMVALSLGGSLIGGGISAMGASQSASAQAASARYSAQVAENNRLIAEKNAAEARSVGVREAAQNDTKTAFRIGEQRVGYAAGNLDVNSGTPAAVQESTYDIGRLDSMIIIENALKRASGYESQADNFEAESRLSYMRADNAETAGRYAVASSLIGGATSFSDKWSTYRTKGVW